METKTGLSDEQVLVALGKAVATESGGMVRAGSVAWHLFPKGPDMAQRDAVALQLVRMASRGVIKEKADKVGLKYRLKKKDVK